MSSSPVAVLIRGQHIVCLSCLDDASYDRGMTVVPIYPVNLDKYDQSCHDCGRQIVRGTFKVELFDAVKCRKCCEDKATGGLHAASDHNCNDGRVTSRSCGAPFCLGHTCDE